MNWEQIKGDWKRLKGQVKQRWAKLTDDDLALLEGKREELSGIIQKRYGLAKEEAELQMEEFFKSCR